MPALPVAHGTSTSIRNTQPVTITACTHIGLPPVIHATSPPSIQQTDIHSERLRRKLRDRWDKTRAQMAQLISDHARMERKCAVKINHARWKKWKNRCSVEKKGGNGIVTNPISMATTSPTAFSRHFQKGSASIANPISIATTNLTVFSRHLQEGSVSIYDLPFASLTDLQWHELFDQFTANTGLPSDASMYTILSPYLQPLTHQDLTEADGIAEILSNVLPQSEQETNTATNIRVKICCWNVNGLHHLVTKGFLQKFLFQHYPDILLLTEIKIGIKKLFKFKALHRLLRAQGYQYTYYHPQQRGYGGLHGTACISKIKPLSVSCGWLHKNQSKDVDGRVMTIFMKQYTIVLTYSPCSSYPERKMLESKRLQKDDERKEFDASMLRHLSAVERQSSKPLIWTGDLNVTPSLVHDVFDGSSNPSRLVISHGKDPIAN